MGITGRSRRTTDLGPLEAAIMDTLWRTSGSLDVESVHRHVAPGGRPVPNTVQSTLERLVRKGLVHRTKHGRAYRYTAGVERRDWFAGAVGALADAIQSRPRQDLLAGFVDFAERIDPKALETLERLVRERLDERSDAKEAEPAAPETGRGSK